ncbi:catalase [Amylostereum chailletii]|nr:catalase [Amylostereum chailletii]
MPSQQVFDSKDGALYTTSNGAPVSRPYAAQKIGVTGPLLLQDFHHIDLLAHFDRERIPERVVHAKGAGAHGYFEVTHDITDLTCASLFKKVGTKARTTIRFSTVGGESGSADTARDPRGFAIKIRTDEGNLDWVFNNTPVFFIRDPAKFPHFIHTQKRDPQTHLKDADMFWDYLSQNPESIHQVMILFSDRGTPDGYHNQHGYSGHTLKFVNENGDWQYVQIHLRADGGFKTLDNETAGKLAGDNPDYGIQGLFEAIENKKFPSWTVYVQTMTPEQAEKFRYNVLDLTKVWPHAEFPLRPIGKVVLNENAQNYFAEIEQAAFSPSHLVPGARPNYQSTISPLSYRAKPYEDKEIKHETWIGNARSELSEINELDFEQPRALYQKALDQTAREHLVHNVAVHLTNVRSAEVKARQLSVFAAVDQSLSDAIAKAIGAPTVAPLKAAPASQLPRYKANIGLAATQSS